MRGVLVIGGTGNVGQKVVSALQARGTPVRIMARDPATARATGNVEVVRGDLTDPGSLDGCLEGIEAVFLVWTAPPDAASPALERIARHAGRIVFLSAPLKTAHPLFQQPNPVRDLHAEIESLIERSGIGWTFLRPGMLAGNALRWWAPQIRAGDVVRWPYLEVPTAPIDERDIAAVAVRALCEDGHAGSDYVLTGPESLSQFEQVSTIGRATGRSLRIEEMPAEEAWRELPTFIPAPPIVKMLMNAWAAAAGQPAFVTSTVEAVTGRPARTFLDWARDHSGEF